MSSLAHEAARIAHDPSYIVGEEKLSLPSTVFLILFLAGALWAGIAGLVRVCAG